MRAGHRGIQGTPMAPVWLQQRPPSCRHGHAVQPRPCSTACISPAPWGTCHAAQQRRCRMLVVACDSTSGGATASTLAGTQAPVAAAPAATDASGNVQEIKGLKQLVLQQQALISTLQQDVQELKNALIHGSSSRASSADANNSAGAAPAAPAAPAMQEPPSWRQSPPQQQQQQQPPQQAQALPHKVVVPLGPPVATPGQAPPAAAAAGGEAQSPSSSSSSPQQQAQQQATPNSPAYVRLSLETFRALPDKVILVRHAESQGNVDATTYSKTPDYEVALSARGWEQAVECGNKLRVMMEGEHGATGYKLFFMTSPYCRTRQTFVGIRQAFPDANFAGVQEEVQLREQDFGNFQDPAKIQADLAERNRFGRFYYRFPDGESGSDVYNRISIFEDHLIRDMKAARFSANTSLCLVTHGLTMRVFLMRWFNWTVESFLQVYNPPNATPIVIEKISEAEYLGQLTKLRERRQSMQVKQAYRLRRDSKQQLKLTTSSTTHIDLVAHNYNA